LPLRLEAAVVDKLDEAWKRQGMKSRMELFRKSLHLFLRKSGENEVAALLTDAAGEKQ
jgi:metal-responsive CopG/Arc/MetJ family transcriptional regulator